ncbi:MAG TPA: amino acid--tRNA ligase-related protein, partial [Planctomycetaceae bacterium]|nr:amino acid--tRNA ligase-related protein [Planctomycetaceae bacterium]
MSAHVTAAGDADLYNIGMSESLDWRPAATLEQLRLRARLLAAVRRFFDERGYWEVDTPIVSRERVVDPHLQPFAAVAEPYLIPRAEAPIANPQSANRNPQSPAPLQGADAPRSPGSRAPAPLYLHTSPEFPMKRLLAAGAAAIYQIAHVFRYGELGRLHNPEFAMVEWYRAGETHLKQMQVVEDLVIVVCEEVRQSASRGCQDTCDPVAPPAPFARTTYREAFRRYAGDDLVVMETGQFPAWAAARGLHPPPGLSAGDRDGWLNWVLA